jgi:geranylgeranylglycerol-phosphate geranylgeranyltransferase
MDSVAHQLRHMYDASRLWAVTVAVAFVALVQITVSDGETRWHYLLLSSVGVACAVFGGYAVNDYFDRDLDKAVHPERLIPAGRMGARSVLGLAFVAFGAAVVFFSLLSLTALVVGMSVILLLIVYTPLKNVYGPLGNVVFSSIAASSVVYGFLTGTSSSVEGSFFLLAAAVFCALLSLEFVRDIEDMDGERGLRRTLPLLFGPTAAFRLAAACLTTALLLLLAFFLRGGPTGLLLPLPIVVYEAALAAVLFNATAPLATPLVRLLKIGFTITLLLLVVSY